MSGANKVGINHKKWILYIGFAVIIILATVLLCVKCASSMQSQAAMLMRVTFQGDYKIGNDEWKPIIKGEHISATKGDVTLKGFFQIESADGEIVGRLENGLSVALYYDHISAEFHVPNQEPHISDAENKMFGDSSCGKIWCGYDYSGTDTDTIQIVLKNPHLFGNENAVDEFLGSMYVCKDIDSELFRTAVISEGSTQRIIGLAVIIISLVLLGVALFSSLLHVKQWKIIWVSGLINFFAGGFIFLNSAYISLWIQSVIFNTFALEICIMLYILCIMCFAVMCLDGILKKIGTAAVSLCGFATALIFILSLCGVIRIFDANVPWVIYSSVVSALLIVCIILNLRKTEKKKRLLCLVSISALAVFVLDVFAAYFGWWKNGLASQYVFILMFLFALILVLNIIPQNILAAVREKELKSELEKNRIAIMISQIQPHFIYNTLGTIEQLCVEQPKDAAKLVNDFSLYLRGNFSELDSVAPISLSKELDHVKHYVNIEKVRFPDITVNFALNSSEFLLPALSIQPLVENAIKHGLMGLEHGGTVTVETSETDTHYCVTVTDDGVGFDTSMLTDNRVHIGLRNIRSRIETMCDGTLSVESTVGKETVATIKIPKEERK